VGLHRDVCVHYIRSGLLRLPDGTDSCVWRDGYLPVRSRTENYPETGCDSEHQMATQE
jgi:hypothetical protein